MFLFVTLFSCNKESIDVPILNNEENYIVDDNVQTFEFTVTPDMYVNKATRSVNADEMLKSYSGTYDCDVSIVYSSAGLFFGRIASGYTLNYIDHITITSIQEEGGGNWWWTDTSDNPYDLTTCTAYYNAGTWSLSGGTAFKMVNCDAPTDRLVQRVCKVTATIYMKAGYGGPYTGKYVQYTFSQCPFDINWQLQIIPSASGYMRIKVNGNTEVYSTTSGSGTFEVEVGDTVFVEVSATGTAIITGNTPGMSGSATGYVSDTGTATVTWDGTTISGVITPPI